MTTEVTATWHHDLSSSFLDDTPHFDPYPYPHPYPYPTTDTDADINIIRSPGDVTIHGDDVSTGGDDAVDGDGGEVASTEEESLKEQVMGFVRSWGEMVVELGRGCKDVVVQSGLMSEDSFFVRRVCVPVANLSGRVKFLNELLLPEDRDPALAWPVVFLVFLLALAVLGLSSTEDSFIPRVPKMRLHPPSANRIQLPDGRNMSYRETGVPAHQARFSIIAVHSFLSSRLAGIPGVKASLLKEYGVRLVSYDLPGFGESDPHPTRNLNSSALDILNLANAIGINDKFWVLGYSTGGMHTWAALEYIPERIAGAVFFAPMINPYEPSMTKEEMTRLWGSFSRKRKLKYFLARKFPNFLAYFYRRSFLSGNHGQIDKWMHTSLGRKDNILIEDLIFEEWWQRDVEESVRQGSVKPFIEEAKLVVSNWGFRLSGLQVQKKCQRKGIFHWLKSMYSEDECELTGFLGPIHIWQGMDDQVVPPAMADYTSRVLPGVNLHRIPNEGHFSYFCFCDECHRKIFSTVFGEAQGPLDKTAEVDEIPLEGKIEDVQVPSGSSTIQ